MSRNSSPIPAEVIERRIYLIRGHKVMLSQDLATLYAVSVKALHQAVKRNAERFPADFMFQLDAGEFASLKSQIVTSSRGGIRRATPYAFTEQGVAMLSGVLRGRRATQVNIAIMRAFVRLRQILTTHKELTGKLAELERKLATHDHQIRGIFDAIRQLMKPPDPQRREIGFRTKPGEPARTKGLSR